MSATPIITAAASIVHFTMLSGLRRIPFAAIAPAMERDGLSGDSVRVAVVRLAMWSLQRARRHNVAPDDVDSIVAAVITEADLFARAKVSLMPPATLTVQ